MGRMFYGWLLEDADYVIEILKNNGISLSSVGLLYEEWASIRILYICLTFPMTTPRNVQEACTIYKLTIKKLKLEIPKPTVILV